MNGNRDKLMDPQLARFYRQRGWAGGASAAHPRVARFSAEIQTSDRLIPAREDEEEFKFSDFPRAIVSAAIRGSESLAIQLAVAFNIRDENRLTDLVFFAHHPERKGRLLSKTERRFRALSREWLGFRNRLVRPIVARAFFAEYDLRFLPGDPQFGIPANKSMSPATKAARSADVTAMVSELQKRLNDRVTDALARRGMGAVKVPSPLDARARRLSGAQLALYREFFPDGSGGINLSAFQFAFELFANGELRNPVHRKGVGEPNGGFFFLFAEFAFLCVDSHIEETVWRKVLRTVVKTQEIFMHIYRPSPHRTPPRVGEPPPKPGPARRKLEDFDFNNFNASGRSDLKRKEKLRAKYDKMTVNTLRQAARDNLLRALRMP
jgi:hypothetical protein